VRRRAQIVARYKPPKNTSRRFAAASCDAAAFYRVRRVAAHPNLFGNAGAAAAATAANPQKSLREIAKEAGVSHETIRQVPKSSGVKLLTPDEVASGAERQKRRLPKRRRKRTWILLSGSVSVAKPFTVRASRHVSQMRQ
jgi:hypothetical protein